MMGKGLHLGTNPVQHGRLLGRAVLGCTLLALGLSLAACNDSASNAASKLGVDKGIQSAKILASAGQPRPTNALVSSISSPLDSAALEARKKDARDPAHVANNVEGGPDTLSADLKNAADAINSVIRVEGLSKVHQSMLKTNAGFVASQQGMVALESMTADLGNVLNEAAAIRRLTNDISVLTTSIQTLQLISGDKSKNFDDQIAAAQKNLDDAKANADQKSKAAADLQTQIDTLKKDASDIYRTTQAKLDAASEAKGLASIDAFNAASKERAVADDKSAAVSGLLPQLAQAQGDAEIAARQASEAEALLKALNDSKATFTAYTASVQREIGSIQDQLRSKVSEKDTGLRARVEAFQAALTSLNGKSAEALKLANDAKASLGNAAQVYKEYTSALKLDEQLAQKVDDPLIKIANKQDIGALIRLQQAGASYQAAIAQLITYSAGKTLRDIAPAVNDAFKAAESTDHLDVPNADVDALKTAAITELKENAIKLSDESAKASGVMGWLGYSLKAVAYQTIADLTRYDKTPDDNAQAEALKAAGDARAKNPTLSFPGIAAASPSPSAG